MWIVGRGDVGCHAVHLVVVVRRGARVEDESVLHREAHVVDGHLDDLVVSSVDLPLAPGLAAVLGRTEVGVGGRGSRVGRGKELLAAVA